MSKCRQLLQENEDLGKMISSGRLAKLESELSMQKALCEEMKKNQVEMDDFVQELDEDVEGRGKYFPFFRYLSTLPKVILL